VIIYLCYIYISIILGVPWLSPEVWVATLVLVLFIISIITETCKFVQRICGAARFFFEAFGALNVSSNNSHCMDCIHNIYIYMVTHQKNRNIKSKSIMMNYLCQSFWGYYLHISQKKHICVCRRIQVLDLAPFGPPLGWFISWKIPI
jgi:hypothetical protein